MHYPMHWRPWLTSSFTKNLFQETAAGQWHHAAIASDAQLTTGARTQTVLIHSKVLIHWWRSATMNSSIIREPTDGSSNAKPQIANISVGILRQSRATIWNAQRQHRLEYDRTQLQSRQVNAAKARVATMNQPYPQPSCRQETKRNEPVFALPFRMSLHYQPPTPCRQRSRSVNRRAIGSNGSPP